MKRDIRSEILAAARIMFGEEGYNDVSMRNIADAVGISVGNLTYHYKKKEDLIEAVIMENHDSYKAPTVPQTLLELHEQFVASIRYQEENAYYFRHYIQLAQCCPKVYEIQRQVKREWREVIAQAFDHLQSEGYIRPEGMTEQFAGIARVLSMVNVYWIRGYDAADEAVSALQCMWSIVYPLLTQKGVAVFRKEIEHQIG